MLFNISHSSRRLLIVAAVAVLFAGSGVTLYGQTTSCPSTSQSAEAWGKGKTVYYNLSNITDPQIKQKIQGAINAWDTANQSNNSGVRFSSAAPPAGAPTISFQIGGSSGSNAGHVDTTINTSTGRIQSATVSFYTAGTTPGGAPIYDSSQAGYYDMFLKVGIHEIGHTMGLGEAPVPSTGYCDQPDGATAMNGYCGTNDSGGNLPTTVTTCDNNTINSTTSPYRTTTPTGGGGGGGGGGYMGGGGGYYPCTPYYWVYYESYDDGQSWQMVDAEYAGCW